MQKQPFEEFFRKDFMINFPEFAKKHLCLNLSFDKIKLYICNFIKIESLEQVFSCEICEISWSRFFGEHHRTSASDRSSINSS